MPCCLASPCAVSTASCSTPPTAFCAWWDPTLLPPAARAWAIPMTESIFLCLSWCANVCRTLTVACRNFAASSLRGCASGHATSRRCPSRCRWSRRRLPSRRAGRSQTVPIRASGRCPAGRLHQRSCALDRVPALAARHHRRRPGVRGAGRQVLSESLPRADRRQDGRPVERLVVQPRCASPVAARSPPCRGQLLELAADEAVQLLRVPPGGRTFGQGLAGADGTPLGERSVRGRLQVEVRRRRSSHDAAGSTVTDLARRRGPTRARRAGGRPGPPGRPYRR